MEREQRVLRAQSEWEAQQREMNCQSHPHPTPSTHHPGSLSLQLSDTKPSAALEDYIARFGAKASHAAMAQSKQKMLDRSQPPF